MKKLMIIILALLLVLPLMTMAATPIDELTELADYAPADAWFFAVIRTDDGYIESLDGVLGNILAKFPEDMVPPGISFVQILDEPVRGFTDKFNDTFVDAIRPWLGDRAAVIVPGVEALDAPSSPLTYVIQVTDRDAAAAFLDSVLVAEDGGFSYYEVAETEDGALLYTSEYSIDPHVLLMDDVLLIGDLSRGIGALVMPGEDAARLSSTEAFADAIAALPEDDYNIFGYVNGEPIVDVLGSFAGEVPELATLDLAEVGPMVGQFAFGFTVLEGRTLVIDIANTGDINTAEDGIDLGLLESVPAGSALVIEGSGIGGTFQLLLDSLVMLDETLVEQGILPIEELGPFSNLGPAQLAAFIRLSLEGTYQIDLQETLEWMNGDFLIFAGVSEDENSPLFGYAPELGMIMSTDNPEATAEFVANYMEIVANVYAPTTFEDGIGVIPLGAFFSMPEVAELIVTSNDNFFAMGTSNSIKFALDPSGPDVTSTDAYAYESGFFLDNTDLLFYVAVEPLRAVALDLIEQGIIPIPERDMEAVIGLLDVLDSASITSTRGDGSSAVRLTLTLGE